LNNSTHITTPRRIDSNCNNNEEAISNQNNNFDCIKLQQQYTSIAGTEAYMAPEIKKHFHAGTFPFKNNDIEINKKQDIYQLGLILYELCH